MPVLLKSDSLLRTALLFLLFIFVVFVSSFLVGYQTAAGYITPSVLLLLTWLLYRAEGKKLSGPGLHLGINNIHFLPLGLLTGVAFLAFSLFIQAIVEGRTFSLNPNVDYVSVAAGFFLLLGGVLNEELIFRGYCLEKTMQRMGVVKANLLFAFLFMVWHWISWNAWGNYTVMFFSITTGLGHLLFAASLLSARTLYFPVGIHLGINWAIHYLFNIDPSTVRADALFVVESRKVSAASNDYINLLITLLCYSVVIGAMWKLRRKNLAQSTQA